jgi:hypothetical protein
MTHGSFSRNLFFVVAAVVMTTPACGSDTTKTTTPSPTDSHATASAAPAAQDAQLPPDPQCHLISHQDALAVLMYDPGPAHIDTSDVIQNPDKMCVWGTPKSFNSNPFIGISFKQYDTVNAAKAAFKILHDHQHNVYTDPTLVRDVAIGGGALVIPFADSGTGYVLANKRIVMILFYLRGSTAANNEVVLGYLDRAVVNHSS